MWIVTSMTCHETWTQHIILLVFILSSFFLWLRALRSDIIYSSCHWYQTNVFVHIGITVIKKRIRNPRLDLLIFLQHFAKAFRPLSSNLCYSYTSYIFLLLRRKFRKRFVVIREFLVLLLFGVILSYTAQSDSHWVLNDLQIFKYLSWIKLSVQVKLQAYEPSTS